MQTFSPLSAVFLYKYHKSCGCGELIRGLQNLGASCERDVFGSFCVVQKEPKSTRGEALRPTIQIAGRYVFEAKMTGIHQVTGNAENSSFPGIAGNDLNRCDAPTLQHKIRANSKRTAVFFSNSRLRMAGMGDGGQKRIALGGN